jgi:hypothetical protein
MGIPSAIQDVRFLRVLDGVAKSFENSPTPISDLTATPNATSVLLEWTPGDGTTSIYRRNVTASGSFILVIADLADSVDSYNNTGLTPENEYQYFVVVENEFGTSPNSNVVTTTTLEEEIPTDYLYETTFASLTARTYSDEVVDIDGVDWYFWVNSPSGLAIINDVTAPSGKLLQCTFTSGAERTSGIVSQSGSLSGTGLKLHVAIDLQYTGYSDLGGIKKTLRFKAGESIVGTLNAQYDKWIWDLADSGGGYYEQTLLLDTHGPSSFIGTTRRLEGMLDFTSTSAPLFSIWVDGDLVLSGTSSAANSYPGGNVDGTYVSTTFNDPAANGTDRVERIIFNNSFIGV